LSSLVSECHCRCKATSCCQVTKTSSGAASGRAPQTDWVVIEDTMKEIDYPPVG